MVIKKYNCKSQWSGGRSGKRSLSKFLVETRAKNLHANNRDHNVYDNNDDQSKSFFVVNNDQWKLWSAPILDPTETVDEEPAPTEIPEDAPLPLDPTKTVDEEPAPTEIPEDSPIQLPIDPVDNLQPALTEELPPTEATQFPYILMARNIQIWPRLLEMLQHTFPKIL